MKKYLLIGAGPVGLAHARALKEAGLDYDHIEANDNLGGNWYHGVYETAHIISPRDVMQYSDYPMPAHFPYFPSRQNLLDYYNEYADHFGLRNHITFNTKVLYVRPVEDNLWEAHFCNDEVRRYTGVLVCNGHHWDKRMPQIEGNFTGEIIHSKDYKRPEQLRGKRIITIGAGNSACDLASEAARVGKKSFISIRSSAWFLPKLLMGQPLSKYANPKVPVWLQKLGLKIGLKILIGDLKHYGLPKPDHALFDKHPTIGTELLHYIKHGRTVPKPGIVRADGKTVTFTDGSQEEIDMIVAATGYHLSYPFLPDELHRTEGAIAKVYGDCMLDDYRGLYLIGWQQARGGVGALAPKAAGLLMRHLKLQEQIGVPLGLVMKEAMGQKLPESHLIGMFVILRNIEKFNKHYDSFAQRARRLDRQYPNFKNKVLPMPKSIDKNLVVF